MKWLIISASKLEATSFYQCQDLSTEFPVVASLDLQRAVSASSSRSPLWQTGFVGLFGIWWVTPTVVCEIQSGCWIGMPGLVPIDLKPVGPQVFLRYWLNYLDVVFMFSMCLRVGVRGSFHLGSLCFYCTVLVCVIATELWNSFIDAWI